MHMHGIGTQRSCQRAVKLFLQVASRGPLVKQLDDAYKLLVAGRAEESFWLYAKAAEQVRLACPRRWPAMHMH